MTLHELIFEACLHIMSQWAATDYDATMETDIETELGALIDVFVDAGVVGDYSLDAGTGYNTATSLGFGQLKCNVELEDAKTGGTESRILTTDGSAVNARSHNT